MVFLVTRVLVWSGGNLGLVLALDAWGLVGGLMDGGSGISGM